MTAMIEITETQKEFHIEEYKQLKAEISSVVDQAWKIFYYSIIFCAGFFGWLVANRQVVIKDHAVRVIDAATWHIVVWIPLLVSLAAIVLNVGLYVRVNEIGNYLRKAEAVFAYKELGWEKDVASRILLPTASFMGRGISKTASMMAVCSLLFVATNFLFACLLWNK